ncbi:unnamed protein product [Paramecium sonneborni]|uniref:Uncharacterized protein n=1 Tax=Paramecium sonneborni TaxID=65129 RepID=A0A8S1RQ53_9CILI|nr:unnamed protein product [Paramecium sonneborni]
MWELYSNKDRQIVYIKKNQKWNSNEQKQQENQTKYLIWQEK